MSEKDYSIDAFNEFFDMAGQKGLIKRNTAQSRKQSANKILEVLERADKADLRQIDVDQVFQRFENLKAKDYTPNSLQVYRSRFRTALSDFISYVDNPTGFKPGAARRTKSGKKQHDTSRTKKKATKLEKKADSGGAIDIPVPLRENVLVTISNLPADLTANEAERLPPL